MNKQSLKDKYNNTTFYLVRHGKAIEDGQRYGDQILTAQLLPEGREEIAKLAQFLKTVPESLNYCSEILRCVQTAQIISNITGKQFDSDPRLNEFHEESFPHFKKRIEDFLESKIEENKTYLICSHGAIISGIKHLILDGSFRIYQGLDYPKTGELLIIKNGKLEIKDF